MEKSEQAIVFTDENVSKLFGKEAAEDEYFERLQSYYIKSRTHERVTSNLPLRILVGHKGIGKSAIFTIARHEDRDNNRVSVLIRPDDISNIGKNEEDFDNLIRAWKVGLLQIITQKICETIHYMLPVENGIRDNASFVTRFFPILKVFFKKNWRIVVLQIRIDLLLKTFLQLIGLLFI